MDKKNTLSSSNQLENNIKKRAIPSDDLIFCDEDLAKAETEIQKKNRKEHFFELSKTMPFKDKIIWAETKIKEFIIWCEENHYDEILISFSGGKDSTVLFHLINKVHKKIKAKIHLVPAYAVEITFPATLKFIREITKDYQKENPYIKEPLLKFPKMPWNQILSEKGYPIFSKQNSVIFNRIKRSKTKNGLTSIAFGIKETARYKISKKRLFLLDDKMMEFPKIPKEYIDYFPKNLSSEYFFSEKCCTYVKGGLKNDKRPSFIGTMASESLLRQQSWINNGCNILNKKKVMSRPLSLWNSNDVWKYIKSNNLKVNEAYNYDENLDLDNQKLRFERLGCTSCPYGSSIEQMKINSLRKNNKIDDEFKLMNRFEKLYQYSPALYKTQIIDTGIFRVLIDMGIAIEFDEGYKKLFDLRHKKINEWYEEKNFRQNFLRVLTQIENYNNYKDFKGKYKAWEYTLDDINKALLNFGVNDNVTITELNKIRSETKKDWDLKKTSN